MYLFLSYIMEEQCQTFYIALPWGKTNTYYFVQTHRRAVSFPSRSHLAIHLFLFLFPFFSIFWNYVHTLACTWLWWHRHKLAHVSNTFVQTFWGLLIVALGGWDLGSLPMEFLKVEKNVCPDPKVWGCLKYFMLNWLL